MRSNMTCVHEVGWISNHWRIYPSPPGRLKNKISTAVSHMFIQFKFLVQDNRKEGLYKVYLVLVMTITQHSSTTARGLSDVMEEMYIVTCFKARCWFAPIQSNYHDNITIPKALLLLLFSNFCGAGVLYTRHQRLEHKIHTVVRLIPRKSVHLRHRSNLWQISQLASFKLRPKWYKRMNRIMLGLC